MTFLEMAKEYWPVVTTFFVASAAVGAQQVQIRNLEQAMEQQIIIQTNQAAIQAQAARVDERTLAIQRDLEHQRQTNQMQFQQLLDAINAKD